MAVPTPMSPIMYDSLVVGGGFFGAVLAVELTRVGHRVVLLEASDDLLTRASYRNQARVHMGYHYPRAFVTAARSRVNAPRFIAQYRDCIHDRFTHYYAIGRSFSKVSAAQFRTFCERIGAPLRPAPVAVERLFNPSLVEAVFAVEEFAFDAVRLRAHLREDLVQAGVEVRTRAEALTVSAASDGGLAIRSLSDGEVREDLARHVYNCTYSRLNRLLRDSGLPPIPLKHELTELLLVEVPEPLREFGVTVMCGPFFSMMPFPPRALHSLSHVRYTPHFEWYDDAASPLLDAYAVGDTQARRSRAGAMLRDAERYLGILSQVKVVESQWEVKTVLPRSEVDDGRPILVRQNHGLAGLDCVAGAKIDNIYDMLERLMPEVQSG